MDDTGDTGSLISALQYPWGCHRTLLPFASADLPTEGIGEMGTVTQIAFIYGKIKKS